MSTNLQSVLDDREYKNWLRAGLSLKFARHGILNFVKNEIDKFYEDVLKLLAGSQCNSCQIIQIRGVFSIRCPNSVCDKIFTAISNEHRFKPAWKNTDCQMWCSDSWQLAKCFMSLGYASPVSAEDTDFAGLLAVIMNNMRFENLVKDDMGNISNIFRRSRDVRNSVLHTVDMRITDTDLAVYIQTLQTMLSNPKSSTTDPALQNAQTRLVEIQNGSQFVTADDEAEFREEVKRAIDENRFEEFIGVKNKSKGGAEIAIKQTADDAYLASQKAPLCTITVSTGKKTNAGTDANVSIVFYGKEKANRIEVPIQGGTLMLGEPCTFTTEIPFVVKCVEISHDNTGESPDWFCERITVLCRETGVEQMFPCRKWLSKTKGDGYIVRTIYEQQEITREDIPSRDKSRPFVYGRHGLTVNRKSSNLVRKSSKLSDTKDSGKTTHDNAPSGGKRIKLDESGQYAVNDKHNKKDKLSAPVRTVTLLTGEKTNAGTDANVSIVFHGKEKANHIKVTIPAGKLKLGKPHTLTTGIPFVVLCVEVSHDNTGESPDWFCERITILCQETGVEQVFPCRKWLSKTKGDGDIFRTIYEQQAITKEVLQDICKKYGRKSSEVVKACDDVRLQILSWSRSFKDVWATYKPAAPDDIVFVVFSEEGSDRNMPPSVKTFDIIHRTINEYSKEDLETRKTESCLFSEKEEDDRKNLTDILQKNGSNLMDTHSNLNIVTTSPVKSKRFALGFHSLKRKPCIVFYVCMKGYIPIQEEELPPAIGRYKTDVREGAFIFYNDPEQYMQRLKIGCSIGLNEIGSGGTLGAFVDLPNGKIGCITSAHVLFTRDELLEFKDRKRDSSSDTPIVYQPAPTQVPISETNNPFGHILSAVYKKGEKRLTGVEAAVVTITDSSRYPDSGKFPMFDTEFTEENQLNYTSGEIYTALPDNINDYMFYKYGAKTGLTSGEITSDGAIVRTSGSLEVRDECELHNQIEISLVDSTPLAEPGDSGSLVLLAPKDNPNNLKALGIVTGGYTTYQVFYVTPIWEVLRALNLPLKLKKFEGPTPMITDDEDAQEQERDTRNADPNEIERHLNEHEIGKVNNKIGKIENEVETVKSKIGEVEGKVDKIRSEMATKTDLNQMATKADLDQMAATMENMFTRFLSPKNTSQNNNDSKHLNGAGDRS